MELTGVLNINKPRGISSNRVVQKIRKTIHRVKAGYAGTLDPDAMGVLPVCLGKSTKIVDFILEGRKVYQVTMHLGIKTDTQDATGSVLKELKGALPDNEAIETVLKTFLGTIEQTPPMYSALHFRGKRMYQLARKGIQVERSPRKVTIYDIRDTRIEDELVHYFVECSKGTYIRTLCDDIGEKLGCGAHLKNLVRVQSGIFCLDEAIDLDLIPELFENDRLSEYIYPMNEVLRDLPWVSIMDQYRYHVLNGNAIPEAWLKKEISSVSTSGYMRILDGSDLLVALGKITHGNERLDRNGSKWIKISKVLV